MCVPYAAGAASTNEVVSIDSINTKDELELGKAKVQQKDGRDRSRANGIL
jgi:hypothetical protein